MTVELCACGKPLHYNNAASQAAVEAVIRDLGEHIAIKTPAGSWMVPRHYIALHGIKAVELPELAKKHGWDLAR